MTELETKLSQILEEKQNKIIPENIKEGVQIFDIMGTLKSGGSSSGVKLFETKEEMQQDPNANEGDLAVVYREEIKNMTSDTQTQYITFPETVTLPNAITESYFCMLRSIDSSSSYFDGNVMLNQNSFRFDGYSNTGMIRISYTSSDGITYTREEFRGDSGDLSNPVDLGTSIHCEVVEQWNDNFGYFMQVGGNVFEGLFRCDLINDMSHNYFFYNAVHEDDNVPTYSYTEAIKTDLAFEILYNQALTDINYKRGFLQYVDDSHFIAYIVRNISSGDCSIPNYVIDSDNVYLSTVYSSGRELLKVSIDTDLKNYSTESLTEVTYLNKGAVKQYSFITLARDVKMIQYEEYNATDSITLYNYANGTAFFSSKIEKTIPKILHYELAPTQLSAAKDSVFNSVYYGQDGVKEGSLTQNVSNSFADMNAEVYYKIQQAYDNMEPRILTDSDKAIDKNIYFIPTNSSGEVLLDTSQGTDMYVMFFKCENLTSIPQLNTSNVTNMNGTFENCTNLKTIANLNTSKVENMNSIFDGCENLISVPQFDTSSVIYMGAMFSRCQSLVEVPQFDTSKVTKMGSMFIGCTNLVTVPQFDMSSIVYSNLFNHDIQNMFSRCPSLSSDSLNNILKSLLTATSYTETKTLAYIGLSEEQATTCTTLSNWSACEAKGWTTGY